MVDTRVTLSGLTLDNPVIPASGTFGFGLEHAELYDISILGSISFKGTTVEKRFGNELPRIAECPAGMINSVGLQNPGLDDVIAVDLPRMAQVFPKPVIANINGFAIEEFAICAQRMNDAPQVGIVEVNISCPNVHDGGLAFGTDERTAARVTAAVKEVCSKPVYVKLSPNVTDIARIAQACVDAGADGISLINTVLGMRIDVRQRRPVVANTVGGLSGPAVFPIALRMVHQVAQAVDVPIMGMGGVSRAEDVIEMMMAGATAVQVGSANLVDPLACKTIIESLPGVMETLGIERLEDIIGIVE